MTDAGVFGGFNYSLNNGFTNSWAFAGKFGRTSIPNMTNWRRGCRHFLCAACLLCLCCVRWQTFRHQLPGMFGKNAPGPPGSAAASKNIVRVLPLWPLKKRLAPCACLRWFSSGLFPVRVKVKRAVVIVAGHRIRKGKPVHKFGRIVQHYPGSCQPGCRRVPRVIHDTENGFCGLR